MDYQQCPDCGSYNDEKGKHDSGLYRIKKKDLDVFVFVECALCGWKQNLEHLKTVYKNSLPWAQTRTNRPCLICSDCAHRLAHS